jgi:hypothetical protein
MRYHARASATVNTTLAPPFEPGQQASRAATIEGPSPAHAVDHSQDLFEPGSRRFLIRLHTDFFIEAKAELWNTVVNKVNKLLFILKIAHYTLYAV